MHDAAIILFTQALGAALIGYEAMPSDTQVVFHAVALAFVFTGMRFSRIPSTASSTL